MNGDTAECRSNRWKIRHFGVFFKLVSPMEYIEWTAPTPHLNLAMDEALLLEAEEGKRGESLRIWFPPSPFVVLGYSRRVTAEVDVDECRRGAVPILRRASGGGTVLQTPGSLCFSLVLRLPSGELRTGITDTTAEVMEKHAALCARLLGEEVRREGESDLTWRGRKFSGNAQRRLVRYVMFHGSFLLNADLRMISRLLLHPEREPAYRGRRTHADFLVNVGIAPAPLSLALASEWGAMSRTGTPPVARAESLSRTRYSLAEWNLRR
jgi:lipoate-protein ligase A